MTTYSFTQKKELPGPWQRLWGEDWESHALTAIALCSVFTVAVALITL